MGVIVSMATTTPTPVVKTSWTHEGPTVVRLERGWGGVGRRSGIGGGGEKKMNSQLRCGAHLA